MHMNFSPVFSYPTRLSKAVTSIIMVLVSAMNLYFLATFLQNLPHRAYLGLLALPAVAYLGLTVYLVLGACSGERETPDDIPPLWVPTHVYPLPGLDLLHRPRDHHAGSQLPQALPVWASRRGE